MMKERIQRIFSKLTEKVDVIVLINGEEPLLDDSFYYATGATSGLFEHCPAFLWPDGNVKIISSNLEETSARATGVQVDVFKDALDKQHLMQDALKSVKSVGINGEALTFAEARHLEKILPEAKLVDVSASIAKARMVKDQKEIASLTEACQIASRVGDEVPSFLNEGMLESEAASEIVFRMLKKGASSISFDTISAFGPSSAEPHYSPASRPLKAGEPALFDYGCRFERYCSDITRTFFVGKVSPPFERMYDVVFHAQQLGIDNIRAGAKASDVDASARSFIDSTEFKGRLIHSLGHGLGLSVHDGGRLAPPF